MTSRTCKTCRHLVETEPRHYRCGWTTTIVMPWPAFERVIEPRFPIGRRHVTGDWSDVMDCPTHEPKEDTR